MMGNNEALWSFFCVVEKNLKKKKKSVSMKQRITRLTTEQHVI